MSYKKHFFLIFFSVSILGCSSIQKVNESKFMSAVKLETKINDNFISFGSGFYLMDNQRNGNFYLVTAKHVIFDNSPNNKNSLKSPIWKITYSDDLYKDFTGSYLINLQLLLDNNQIWFNTKDDVVVIAMGRIIRGKLYRSIHLERINLFTNYSQFHRFINKESLVPLEEIKIGSDVFMSGYPNTIGLKQNDQYDYDKPLIRKGITSAIYPQKRTFLIDCPSFGGNSGGPVFLAETNINSIKDVMGIIIEKVPFKEDNQQKYNDNSNYTVVVSSSVILDIINNNSGEVIIADKSRLIKK